MSMGHREHFFAPLRGSLLRLKPLAADDALQLIAELSRYRYL